MQLPETFDWRAFISVDGRETTESQVLGAAAEEFIKHARNSDDLPRMRSAVLILVFRAVRGISLHSSIGDYQNAAFVSGCIDGARDRGAYGGLRLFFRSLAMRILSEFFFSMAAGRLYEMVHPFYWLGDWYLTGNENHLSDIYETACGRRGDDLERAHSAASLITWASARDAEFAAAIAALERGGA